MPDALNNIFSQIRWLDFIDVAVVAFIVYKILAFIEKTRASQLLKGLLVLLIATEASGLLKLYTINWILQSALTLGMVAIIIIFQPELRRGLQYLGRGTIWSKNFQEADGESADRITENILQAINILQEIKLAH